MVAGGVNLVQYGYPAMDQLTERLSLSRFMQQNHGPQRGHALSILMDSLMAAMRVKAKGAADN